MSIYDQEGLLEMILTSPQSFCDMPDDLKSSRLGRLLNYETLMTKSLPATVENLLHQIGALKRFTEIKESIFTRTNKSKEPGPAGQFEQRVKRPLKDLLSGEFSPDTDTSPQVIQLLFSNQNEIGGLLQLIKIPWNVKNYTTLEPMQKKILALESDESKIAQLLHLARLRGGISDLLEVLNLDIEDDQKFGYQVTDALTQLENRFFAEMVTCRAAVFHSDPVFMHYKLPDTVKRIAWNGTHLFYITGKQNKELHKCAGDTKQADFGKQLFSVSWNFNLDLRHNNQNQSNNTHNEDRQNYVSNKYITIAANNTHVFCMDDYELLVFDMNLVFQSKLAVPNARQLDCMTCSNDGTVIMNSQTENFYKFTPNDQNQYVKTAHTKTIPNVTKQILKQERYGTYEEEKDQFCRIGDGCILIQENQRLLVIGKDSFLLMEVKPSGDHIIVEESVYAQQTTDYLFGYRRAYNSTSQQILVFVKNTFIVRETSQFLRSALKATQNTPSYLNSFFGLEQLAHSDVNIKDLKAKVQVLIKEIQSADLTKSPDQDLFNYVVSQRKYVYQQIIKTKNKEILHLNLQMLGRQQISLKEATRCETFEMELLESLKQDEPSFKAVWPFVSLDTVKEYRGKYPECDFGKKTEEELVWEDLSLFYSQKRMPADGNSIFGDIIRLGEGEKVSRKELQDQSAFVNTIFCNFHQLNLDFTQFDGILSGGQSKTQKVQSCPNILKALKKLNEGERQLNLGGEKADVFMELTEQTFLAMINLNDLSQRLDTFEQYLSKGTESELVERLKNEKDIYNYPVFTQIWEYACKIQEKILQSKAWLPGQQSQADIDEHQARLLNSLRNKCTILQSLNEPFIIQNKIKGQLPILQSSSSVDSDQDSSQTKAAFSKIKQDLLKKKENLSDRVEVISQSVLDCLQSDYNAEDFLNYLKDAEVLAKNRLEIFESLLKSVTDVSQSELADFIGFLIDFQLSPTQKKYSYFVSGVEYKNQKKIQQTLFLILKKLKERCKSDVELVCFLRLIRTLRFTARDFEPLRQDLNIFELLYGIKGSELTFDDVVDQVLLRLDYEKKIKTIGLSKHFSTVDHFENNQLLSSFFAIFTNEMECLIDLWVQIEKQGPVTKSSYKQVNARYTNELILESLVEVEQESPNQNLDQSPQVQSDDTYEINTSQTGQTVSSAILKAKITQQKVLLKAQEDKYGFMFSLLPRISDRCDRHEQLCLLFIEPKTLSILLSSLAVLSTNLGSIIVNVLIKVFTHDIKVSSAIIEGSCKNIWPEIKSKVNVESNFTSYVLGLATYLGQPEQQVVRAQTSNFCFELLRLAGTTVGMELLKNFTEQSEFRQLQILDVYQFSLAHNNPEISEAEFLYQIEGFLNEEISVKVKSSVLSLLIKGEVSNLKPETIVFLTSRSLFSRFEIYQPQKIFAQLKHNYDAIKDRQAQQWVDSIPGFSNALNQSEAKPIEDGSSTYGLLNFNEQQSSNLPQQNQTIRLDASVNQPGQINNGGRGWASFQDIPSQRNPHGGSFARQEHNIDEMIFGHAGSSGIRIDQDEEEVLARVLHESQQEYLRQQDLSSLGQTQRQVIPEVVSEERKTDLDQISDFIMNENDEFKSKPIENVDREHIKVSSVNELPKNVLLDQLLLIVDCLSLPPQIIFDILKDQDETFAPKFERYNSDKSSQNLAQLKVLLNECISLIPKEKFQHVLTSICRVLIEHEPQQQDSDTSTQRQIQVQALNTDPNWIEKASTEELEDSWIDLLSQALLVRYVVSKQDKLSLFIAAKHYSDQLTRCHAERDFEKSWVDPVDFEQVYELYIQKLEEGLLQEHIQIQTNIEAACTEQKFMQLIFYTRINRTATNQGLLQSLKLLAELFGLVANQKDLQNTFKGQILRLVKLIAVLTKDIGKSSELKKTLEVTVNESHPDFEYFKLHLNVAFADVEKPRDKFESCVAIIKDLDSRNFARLLTLDEVEDKQTLQMITSHFSARLLHRVQKIIRDNNDNSFDKEFPAEGNKEERVAAGLVMQITKKFKQDSQHWVKPDQIKMLAEDLESELRQLALRSKWLIPYQYQYLDPRTCPEKFDARNNPKVKFMINRRLARRLTNSSKAEDKSNPMRTLFSQLLVNIKQHQRGFEIMRQDSPRDRAFQVCLVHEDSSDERRTYKNFFKNICAELMSADLPILIKSLNEQDKQGDDYDGMLLNFDCQTKEYFVFFGVLLGYAIRTNQPLSLNLKSVVWKQINGTELTLEDLKACDLCMYNQLEKIRKAEPKEFESNIDQCFTVVLQNGTELQLVEEGASIKVTFDNRESFVHLATQAHLHAMDKQADWVREGVEIICGKNNLAHLYWMILEERACGQPNIDIAYF